MENETKMVSFEPDKAGELTFMIPSGWVITIRESNGRDEDEISKMRGNPLKAVEAMCMYASGLIVKTNIPGQEKPTPSDIMKWKISDRYYVLLKCRIHSLGDVMKFKWEWPEKPELPIEYVEDLNTYDRPLHIDDGIEAKDWIKVKMYKLKGAAGREIVLTSGKKIRYEFLTGVGEKQALEIPEGQTTVNTELIVRNFQWLNTEGAWINVQDFSIFTSREMKAIRKDVMDHDYQFDLKMKLENPYTQRTQYVPLIGMPDFFFPTEI